MDILTICNFITEKLGRRVYPLKFPINLPEDCIKAEVITSGPPLGGVVDYYLEIMVKSRHQANGERLALLCINRLDRQTNHYVEVDGVTYQIILCVAQTPGPSYVGELDDGTFLFKAGFKLLITKV